MTQEEIDKINWQQQLGVYQQQVANSQLSGGTGQTSTSNTLWPGVQANLNYGYTIHPGQWNTIYTTLKQPTFVHTGGGVVLTLTTDKDNLGEHYALANPPEQGRMYQLVCSGVEERNGQLVAKFVLV